MTRSRRLDTETGTKAGEQESAPTTAEQKPTGKTMQELERLQFDALDRAGFDRS